MNQIRFRQIARLERRALPYIQQREGIAQRLQNLRHGAVSHAAVLIFLMRYGNPQIGEPLSEACRRVAESEVWKACCEKFHCKCCGKSLFEPYDRPSVSLFGDPLRHVLLSTLAGADEKDKLNRVFKSAPPWLIWFTFADYTAKLLDLNLPDLSSVRGFERSKDIFYGERSKGIFYGWWALPESAFECRPWPNGADREPLARTDLNLLRSETAQDTPITNRERKRALANSARSSLSHQIDWPYLTSEEHLQVDPYTSLAQLREAGYLGGDGRTHPEFCGVDVRHRRPRSGY